MKLRSRGGNPSKRSTEKLEKLLHSAYINHNLTNVRSRSFLEVTIQRKWRGSSDSSSLFELNLRFLEKWRHNEAIVKGKVEEFENVPCNPKLRYSAPTSKKRIVSDTDFIAFGVLTHAFPNKASAARAKEQKNAVLQNIYDRWD